MKGKDTRNRYLAHRAEDGREQTNLEHLVGTAQLSARFAKVFGAEGQGYLAGMAHDIGKYSTAFQRRLDGSPERVDHSTAGAYECWKRGQLFAAFAVAGHHTGLPDGGGQADRAEEPTFCGRMKKAIAEKLEPYDAWKEEVTIPSLPPLNAGADQSEGMFFTRMLYSCLVDADFLDAKQIKDMANATKAFSKDVEGLESKLRYLDKSQDKLSSSITKSKKTIGELQKEFDKTGDAAVGLKLETERFNLHTMNRELELTRKEVRETEREIRDMTNETKRAKGLGGIFSGLKDSMATHGESQLWQMVSQSAQQLLDTGIASAYGDDEGGLISSIVNNAITGASLGLYAGHPIAGAAIGAATGFVEGSVKRFTKRDDYFKSYYNGIIDQQAEKRASDIQTGSSIAAGREKDRISFTTLFGGDQDVAEGYLHDLVGMANTTPFLYDDLTAMSKTLATYGYGADSILPVLTKIGDAGAALGMNTSDMTMVATALGRMKSSDKASLEYLNILNDRGIGAVSMLAEAKGMSVGATYDAISQGKIKGGEAVA